MRNQARFRDPGTTIALVILLVGAPLRPASASGQGQSSSGSSNGSDSSKGSGDSSNSSNDSSKSSNDSSHSSNDSSKDSDNSTQNSPKNSSDYTTEHTTKGSSDWTTHSHGAHILGGAGGRRVGATALGIVMTDRSHGGPPPAAALAGFMRRQHAMLLHDVSTGDGPVLDAWAHDLRFTVAEKRRLRRALDGSEEQGALIEALDGTIDEAHAERFGAAFVRVTDRALGPDPHAGARGARDLRRPRELTHARRAHRRMASWPSRAPALCGGVAAAASRPMLAGAGAWTAQERAQVESTLRRVPDEIIARGPRVVFRDRAACEPDGLPSDEDLLDAQGGAHLCAPGSGAGPLDVGRQVALALLYGFDRAMRLVGRSRLAAHQRLAPFDRAPGPAAAGQRERGGVRVAARWAVAALGSRRVRGRAVRRRSWPALSVAPPGDVHRPSAGRPGDRRRARLASCPAFERWADLDRLADVEIVLATPSTAMAASLFGHILLRLVYRDDDGGDAAATSPRRWRSSPTTTCRFRLIARTR